MSEIKQIIATCDFMLSVILHKVFDNASFWTTFKATLLMPVINKTIPECNLLKNHARWLKSRDISVLINLTILYMYNPNLRNVGTVFFGFFFFE